MQKVILALLVASQSLAMDEPVGLDVNKLPIDEAMCRALCFDQSGQLIELKAKEDRCFEEWQLWADNKPISKKYSGQVRYKLTRLDDGILAVMAHMSTQNDQINPFIFSSNGKLRVPSNQVLSPMGTVCMADQTCYAVNSFNDSKGAVISIDSLHNCVSSAQEVEFPDYSYVAPAGFSCWENKLPFCYELKNYKNCTGISLLDVPTGKTEVLIAASQDINGHSIFINRASMEPNGILFYGCGKDAQASLVLCDARSKTKIAALKGIYWAPKEDQLKNPVEPFHGEAVLTPRNNNFLFATLAKSANPQDQAIIKLWDRRKLQDDEPVKQINTNIVPSEACDLSPGCDRVCGLMQSGDVSIVEFGSIVADLHATDKKEQGNCSVQ